jgi:hypothetical protein
MADALTLSLRAHVRLEVAIGRMPAPGGAGGQAMIPVDPRPLWSLRAADRREVEARG